MDDFYDFLFGGGLQGLGGIGLLTGAYNQLGDLGQQGLQLGQDLAQTQMSQTGFQPFTITTPTGATFSAAGGAPAPTSPAGQSQGFNADMLTQNYMLNTDGSINYGGGPVAGGLPDFGNNPMGGPSMGSPTNPFADVQMGILPQQPVPFGGGPVAGGAPDGTFDNAGAPGGGGSSELANVGLGMLPPGLSGSPGGPAMPPIMGSPGGPATPFRDRMQAIRDRLGVGTGGQGSAGGRPGFAPELPPQTLPGPGPRPMPGQPTMPPRPDLPPGISAPTGQPVAAPQSGGGGTYGLSLSGPEQAFYSQMFGGAGGFFEQAAQPVAEREAEVFERMQENMRPQQERERLELEQRLAAQGRLGTRSNMYGGTPEQLSLAKAQEEARNSAMLSAMGFAGQEQDRLAGLGSQYLGAAYLPQAQALAALAPGMNAAAMQQQAQLTGAGLFGEATASGIDALLGAGLGQANLMGTIGSGLLSGLTKGTDNPLVNLLNKYGIGG